MKKKIVMIIVAVFILVIGMKTGDGITKALYSNDNIYNDDSKIIQSGDTYSYTNQVYNRSENSIKMSFKLSGMETLWEVETTQDTFIDIEYDAHIKDGNLKLVMIHEDNTIETILDQSGNELVSIPIKKGLNRIKIVGKSAHAELNFEIIPRENTTVKARD